MAHSPSLTKLGISALNPMQRETAKAILGGADVVLLSPTGTGKTLAFLLPLLDQLDPKCEEIQALILVPTRELAQQLEQVTRTLGSGYKVNAVYGGRSGSLDRLDLKHRPAVLIGTPGRLADRLRRDDFSRTHLRTLVLDEYDKSLEIGFEAELKQIVHQLPKLRQRILTSATSEVEVPDFIVLTDPISIDYLHQRSSRLSMVELLSPDKDKLEALVTALRHIGEQPGIVFCNYKAGLQRISDHLHAHGLAHSCFHGSMEQVDRDRSLIQFRNGTTRLLLATDLAARGLDIPALHFILHYHLPPREKEFTHRNGRTARMNQEGVAYLLRWDQEERPEYLQALALEGHAVSTLAPSTEPAPQQWRTLYLTGGRRDKISKGDVAGLFLKQGGIAADQLGVIELQQTCAYAAVHAEVAQQLVGATTNSKLKKKKVRVSVLSRH